MKINRLTGNNPPLMENDKGGDGKWIPSRQHSNSNPKKVNIISTYSLYILHSSPLWVSLNWTHFTINSYIFNSMQTHNPLWNTFLGIPTNSVPCKQIAHK